MQKAGTKRSLSLDTTSLDTICPSTWKKKLPIVMCWKRKVSIMNKMIRWKMRKRTKSRTMNKKMWISKRAQKNNKEKS